MTLTIYFLILLAAVKLVTVFWLWKKPAWMGFSGLTLWNWIVVFALPFMVASTAGVLGYFQAQVEEDRVREESLQIYVDRISDLSITGFEKSGTIAVARAHTNAVLRLVDKERAGRALAFLGEMDLLQKLQPTLEHVDLVGAELKGLNLRGMDFEGSNLRKAELENADLRGVDFEGSDLRGTDFKDADVRWANFGEANVKGADFDHADLRGADLAGAVGAKSDQLLKACLDAETVLPVNFVLDFADSKGCEGTAESD